MDLQLKIKLTNLQHSRRNFTKIARSFTEQNTCVVRSNGVRHITYHYTANPPLTDIKHSAFSTVT